MLPELKMLTSMASEDKFVGFHLTGKLHDIMPIMLEAEPDFILRFESPTVRRGLLAARGEGAVGRQGVHYGWLRSPHLHARNPGGYAEGACRCIDEAGAGGGFILANTDAIPEGAGMEDVKAMVDFAKTYGRY